ncbi:MAG TPA: DUF4232 domain-containing protein [Acidimicrobiales bacterium]|nr:DUF4232 domain-containing protein [Acidimicrobiales bacterium]
MTTRTAPLTLVTHRSRITALLAVAALAASLVVLSPGSRASAAVPTACLPSRVAVTNTVSSRPGGTTAQLVFTSRSAPSCLWSVNSTGYQFVAANGLAIGPVVYQLPRPLTTRWTPIHNGFQVVARVTTMAGVQCTTRSASRLRVGAPGTATLLVKLATHTAMGVGGTTAWTSVTTTLPVAPRCRSAALSMSLGASNGAAGTIYYALVFRNISTSACVVTGIPTVRAMRSLAAADYVGARARAVTMAGYGLPIRLAPGARASVAYGVTQTGNYPSATCAPAPAVAVAVTVSGARGVIPLKFSICTKVVSTSIRGVVAGVSGNL